MAQGIHVVSVDHISLALRQARQEEHRHPWHELIYVLSGRYRARTDDGLVEGTNGISLVYRAGVDHTPLRGDDPARIVLVKWEEEPPVPRTLLAEDPTGRIRTALMWLWDVVHDGDRVPASVLTGLLEAVLYQRERMPEDPDDGPVTRARRYLAQNLNAIITMDEVAGAVGVSPATLNRRFKAELGTTPMAWRRNLRVETALTLLRDGGLDLAAIAAEVGVATPFHLSHLVKSATGRPPRAWRRRPAAPRTD